MQKYYISADGRTLYQVSKDYRGEIVIPEGVRTIAGKAFANCKWITGVELPPSLLEIGVGAFLGCESLTRIEIPCGIERIPDHCFYECGNLAEVVMQEGVESIGYAAFFGCHSLCRIDLPYSLREIGEEAFLGCRALTAIELRSGLKRVGCYAFQGSGLTAVRLGASKESIRFGTGVFWGTGLRIMEVDPGNEVYTDAGCNVIMEKRTGRVIFGSYMSRIPDTATVIAETAFGATPKELVIPSSVKRIESCAFLCNGCSIRLGEGVEEIEIGAFQLSGYPHVPSSVHISSSVRVIQGQSNGIDFLIDAANPNYYYDSVGRNIISRDGKLVWGRLLEGIPEGVRELHVQVCDDPGFTDLIIPESVGYVSDGIFGSDCCYFDRIVVNKGTRIAFPSNGESECEIVVMDGCSSWLSDGKNRVQCRVFPAGTSARVIEQALGGPAREE